MIQWLQKKQNEGGVASAAPAKGAKQNVKRNRFMLQDYWGI
jgi:hypothetical protein